MALAGALRRVDLAVGGAVLRRGRPIRALTLLEHGPKLGLRFAELFQARCERINAGFDRILDLIEAALQERSTLVVKGALVNVGPDHYARLKAGHLFLRLIS